MELSFESRELRDICQNPQRALQALPEEVCHELQDRLADLDAADSMAELVVGRPQIDPRLPGRVRYALPEGFELVCVGNYAQPPLEQGGHVRLDRMRRIRVIWIGKART